MEQRDGHPAIEVDPLIRFGKPRIRGTKITVGDVLHWLAAGMTVYVKWSTSQLVLPDPPYRQDR